MKTNSHYLFSTSNEEAASINYIGPVPRKAKLRSVNNLLFSSISQFFVCLFIAAFIATGKAQTTYTFTNCGATGQFGPNQGQVNTAYASTNLNGLVTVSGQGIQLWTVPGGGMYRITVYGAQGGDGAGKTGGLGAKMEGEFNIPAGTILKIIVGQRGGSRLAANSNTSGAGGGGSFVADASNIPYIVAGGGGGAGFSLPGMPGVIGLNGTNSASSAGAGGINGGGGGAGQNGLAGTASTPGGDGSSCSYGAGGAGFYTNGGQNCSASVPLIAGTSFINGGIGGPGDATRGGVDGGFGGGAGVGHRASGGGGWSGGGGDGNQDGGGGGGSYNNGTNQNNASGVNSGDGLVLITRLCPVDLQASKNPMCLGESITLSTNAVSNIVWAHNGSTNSSVNVSPTSNTQYTVTGQAASGCTTSIILTVTVNPVPSLSAAVTPSVLCVGKTATVAATGATSYTWTTLSATAPTATVNPVVTTNYNYSGTNQYGCVSSAIATVIVNTNSLGITPNSSVCAGESILLTASNAITYTWSTGNNFASTPVSPLTNTTYLASGTDIHNCVISNAVNITVQTKPNVSASASRNTICKGETANLLASGADTYTWSSGLGTGAQVTINPPVDVVYSYTVTGTSANNCTNTAVVSVAVSRCSGLSKLNGDKTGVKVYPNPTNNEVSVELSNNLPGTIEILDLTGRIVMLVATKEENTRISLNALSDGVYYLKVISAEQTEIIKVVKNN